MMQPTYLMARYTGRVHKYTPPLRELAKSVDGDKCRDLIYLVDKRINCCNLPQTPMGVGGAAIALLCWGKTSWKRRGLRDAVTDERGRACQDLS